MRASGILPFLNPFHLFLRPNLRGPSSGSFCFFAGHAWVAASLWVHQWLLIIPMSCVCVQCFPSHVAMLRTHAPSRLWPGLPKEPPQANSTFLFFYYNFCSFCTSWQTSSVRMELNEAISVWNTSSFWCDCWVYATKILLQYAVLCDRSFFFISHLSFSVCTNAHWYLKEM